MANRIKGITVEIGGDTTKLSKALEGVNKTIKNTQTQLKDVEKLLKLDPTNTELLSQKQRLLADSITATKDKLATLKTAAEQANQALANGEISQEQYDALQREIVETENELQRLQNEAGKTNTALAQIDAAGEVLQNVGDKISGVGEKLLPVTAGVTALGTAAVKTASDFDSAMSKVAAISGVTGDDIQALRDKAREMGSKTKYSATEAANAFEFMSMAGWKTTDMLDGIEGIMNLAGQAWNWGSDIIGGIVNGIRSKINDVVSAVTNVADTIRSYLHFSVPDVGPLTDFESWMPDFMSGLAEGIQKNKKLITNAISGVAESMQLTMKNDMGVNFDGMTASMKDTVSAGTVVNNYNNSRTVNQTNNSPKSLSRLEIYRQTRNAMM